MLLVPRVESVAAGRDVGEQRRRRPVAIPVYCGEAMNSRQDGRGTESVGIPHRAASEAREAVAVAPDGVDVAGRGRDALRQNARAFIDKRDQAAIADFAVLDSATCDAQPLRLRGYQGVDLRVRHGPPRSLRVEKCAAAGLLAQATGLDQQIGDAVISGVIRQILALTAYAVADIETGEVADRIGTHGHAEAFHRRVNLRGRGAFEQEQMIFAAVGIEHSITDKAETIADDDA